MKISNKLKLASALFPAIYLLIIWLYVISFNAGNNLPISIWKMAGMGAILAFTIAYSLVTFIVDLTKLIKSN